MGSACLETEHINNPSQFPLGSYNRLSEFVLVAGYES